jgi:hypothetical protein
LKTLDKGGLFHAQTNPANIAAPLITATVLASHLLQPDIP